MLTETIWWLLLIAAAIVLILAIYLAVLNWNESIQGATVSVLLGAAVAFFVSVVTPLKAVKIHQRFVAPIVIDASGNTVWLGEGDALPPPRLRPFLMSIRSLSKQSDSPALVPLANPRQPTKEEQSALFKLTSQLLQQHLLHQFITLGPNPGVGVEVSDAIQFELWEAVTGATARIRPEQIVGFTTNPFAAAKQEAESLRLIGVPTPPKTAVRFVGEPLGIEFKRAGYFSLTLEIKSLGDLYPVPEGFEYLGSLRKDCRTYPYLVELKAEFNRLTAGSKYSRDAQAWVRAAGSMLLGKSGRFAAAGIDS